MKARNIESFVELQEFMVGKTIDRINQGDSEYDDENDIYPVGVDLIIFTDGTFVELSAYSSIYRIGEGAVVDQPEKPRTVTAKSISGSTIITGNNNVVGL